MHGTRRTTALLIFGALLSILLALPAAQAQHRPHAGMMRFPDVSATQIVFAYRGELWLVARDGGLATPLATPPGAVAFPRFSADGQTVAFLQFLVQSVQTRPEFHKMCLITGMLGAKFFHPAAGSFVIFFNTRFFDQTIVQSDLGRIRLAASFFKFSNQASGLLFSGRGAFRGNF